MIADVYFTYALAGLCVAAILANAVRIAVRQPARSERVERAGGSILLGKGLMNWAYWAVEPAVRGLAAIGVSANALTWSSLVLGVGAGVAVATGWFGLGCLLATCSTVGDLLDGQVARLTNTGSDRGELLDAAIDRYTEGALLIGLAIFFRASVPLMFTALIAWQASFMISYASAKAEALHVAVPNGLMRRHERSTYLIVGVGLSSLIGDRLAAHWPTLTRETPAIAALVLIAVVGNVAAVVRFVRIGRGLR